MKLYGKECKNSALSGYEAVFYIPTIALIKRESELNLRERENRSKTIQLHLDTFDVSKHYFENKKIT